jgi:hypothetical protein
MIRFALLKLGHLEHVFAVGWHHINFDGWSVGILLNELTALYTAHTSGVPHTLPDLPIQYSDFSISNRTNVAATELERLRDFWKMQLNRLPACVDLVTDKERPREFSLLGGSAAFALPSNVYSELRTAARRHGTTPQIILLTAYMLLIRHTSKSDDIFVRCVVSGRNLAETEQLIGLFMQSVIVRAKISNDDSLQDVLAKITETFCDALEHSQIPAVHLEQIVGQKRDDSYYSRVPFAFNYHSYPRAKLMPPKLTINLMDKIGDEAKVEARLDLVLHTVDTGQSLRAQFVYYADIFSEARINELAHMYQRIVGELCSVKANF